VFDAIVKFVVPGPFPDAPLVIVRKEALLAAVHVQPAAVETVVLPVPVPEPGESDVGLIE
jgi:hypothetical protein